MKFIESFEKQLEKVSGIGGKSSPPRYWSSYGNHVVNYTLTGDFNRGVPQGRVLGLAGPSGAGKSFLLGSAIREAQQLGYYTMIIDSENAFDDEFAEAIGIDPTMDTYMYKDVITVDHVIKIVSSFIAGYKKEFGDDPDAPKVLIGIDSLDMLMTSVELEKYDKGEAHTDMGIKSKQLKAMLRTFVQDIKDLNISIICTCQVYKNQDIRNGEGVWIVSDAVKFSMSMITMITKLRLRGEAAGTFKGIKMRVHGYKTRFAKPFQTVEIEVPYDSGLDPYAGLVEAAGTVGVTEKRGSRWKIIDEDASWYAKDLTDDQATRILELLEKLKTDGELVFDVDSGLDEDVPSTPSVTKRRQELADARRSAESEEEY